MTITACWFDEWQDKSPNNSNHKTQTIVAHTASIIITRHPHWGMQSPPPREVDRLKLLPERLCVFVNSQQATINVDTPCDSRSADTWNDSNSEMTCRICILHFMVSWEIPRNTGHWALPPYDVRVWSLGVILIPVCSSVSSLWLASWRPGDPLIGCSWGSSHFPELLVLELQRAWTRVQGV